MKKIRVRAKRLGTIAHYLVVVCEYIVVILLSIWLNIVLKSPSLFRFPLFKAFGFALVALGLFLIVWSCWLQFKMGQGTTGFSEPTRKLVTCGSYSIVRNPIMFGQFLFFAGLGFLLNLVAMFLILPILILFMHLFIIFIEEPNLKSRFGQEWVEYVKIVPRWFPRLGGTHNNISVNCKNWGDNIQQELWDEEKAEKHARWAKMASRLYYAPFARRIAENIAPLKRESATIIDLGTGSGILSIELNKLLPQVKIIGIDPSSEMLEIARKNADEAEISNYETRLGRAEEIPVESNSVDLVVSQFSFHEWKGPQKGLLEIFRVLKPGGSFMLRDFNRDWFSKWKLSLFKFFIMMIGESYEDHLEMFKFTFEEIADLLKETGFDEIKGNGRGPVLFVQALKGT